jgi:hypothetical protein
MPIVSEASDSKSALGHLLQPSHTNVDNHHWPWRSRMHTSISQVHGHTVSHLYRSDAEAAQSFGHGLVTQHGKSAKVLRNVSSRCSHWRHAAKVVNQGLEAGRQRRKRILARRGVPHQRWKVRLGSPDEKSPGTCRNGSFEKAARRR